MKPSSRLGRPGSQRDTITTGLAWRAAFCVCAAALITGCATGPMENEADAAQAVPVDHRATVESFAPAPDPEAGLGLSEYTLYRMLIGEFAGQRGHLDIAVDSYLDLAKRGSDPPSPDALRRSPCLPGTMTRRSRPPRSGSTPTP